MVDIDLAIERKLAFQHVYFNPTILVDHTFRQKTMVIPRLTMPPYLIDFGYVVFYNTVDCTARLINYGPVATSIRLKRLTDKKSKEMAAQGKY